MPTTAATDDRKPIPVLPPLNWRRQVPKYRVVSAVHPSPNDRHRYEQPFSNFSDGSVWQQADRLHEAGEVIETTEWPHPAFFPLNYSAKMVLEFFRTSQKSRLPRSPYDTAGNLRLDDVLSNGAPRIASPKPDRVDLHPRHVWPGM